MSVVVTENQQRVPLDQATIDKARLLLGAKTDGETLERALEKVIEQFEANGKSEEAEQEHVDIDVHELRRIPPKKTFTVTARFRIVGRGKPKRYDFSDYFFDGDENEGKRGN